MIFIHTDILEAENYNALTIMKLKISVIFTTAIIFFIRLFYKNSVFIFDNNIEMLFSIKINTIFIYLYQALIIIYITNFDKVKKFFLIFLLLINIFLILSYCLPYKSLFQN
jgi:hypothetical protein